MPIPVLTRKQAWKCRITAVKPKWGSNSIRKQRRLYTSNLHKISAKLLRTHYAELQYVKYTISKHYLYKAPQEGSTTEWISIFRLGHCFEKNNAVVWDIQYTVYKTIADQELGANKTEIQWQAGVELHFEYRFKCRLRHRF